MPRSLTARLVLLAVVLVALVGALLATATSVTLSAYLTSRLDDDVRAAAERDLRVLLGQEAPPDLDDDGDGRGPGGDGPGTAFGQGAGTVSALLLTDQGAAYVLTRRGDREELGSAALERLAGVPRDGDVHDVSLPGLGDHRAVARPLATTAGDATVVTALPTDDVRGTVGRLVGVVVLLTLLAVAVVAVVGRAAVRRELRPLQQVAATAHDVALLPLSRGEVGEVPRVPEALTDEATEAGQVGAALNSLLDHVEQALGDRQRSEEQVRSFVADASHELRTPLTTIRGYAELALRRAGDGADGVDAGLMAESLAKVRVEADRMAALVDDLLLLARLDAGRPLDRGEVDLTLLLLEAVPDARVTGPDHRWELDLPDEPVTVVGDAQRLHQVVTNLLGNARRHTPPGTTVVAGVRALPGGGAVVRVRDDGPGVPAELRPTLFDRFARGGEGRARGTGGTGLGLAIVRAVARAHGGDVAVEHADERAGAGVGAAARGTTFTVTLPAAPPTP